MGNHSRLSASGSKRWINCPGSIQAEEAIPRSEKSSGSPAAREGTAAHCVVEFCFREGINADEMLGWRIGVPIDEADHPDPVMLPADSGQQLSQAYDVFEVDDNMTDACQVMLDWVREQLNDMDNPDLLLEENYDLSWVHPGMGGTADVTASEDFGLLLVADYKHGRGVPVRILEPDAFGKMKPNTQALYYAAGAAHDAGWTHERCLIAIVQPRCPEVENVQTLEIDIKELRAWAEGELRKAAELVDDDDPIRVAGDWCKWCTAASRCETLRSKAFAVAKADFSQVPPEDDIALPVPTGNDELSRAMAWIPMIDSWVKSVNGEVQRRLEAGQEIDNYKLVRKRSNRRYDPGMSEDEVVKHLMTKTRGECKKADLIISKPKPLTQVEKLGPKAKAAVAEITVKPEGGLTVAHVSDKRPVALLSNTSDFDGVED